MASNLSDVFFLDKQTKIIEGRMIQTKKPIVDPTKPRTASIDGTSRPVTSERVTISSVMHWNFVSGMCDELSAPPVKLP